MIASRVGQGFLFLSARALAAVDGEGGTPHDHGYRERTESPVGLGPPCGAYV